MAMRRYATCYSIGNLSMRFWFSPLRVAIHMLGFA